MCNSKWRTDFSFTKVNLLPTLESDHKVLFLESNQEKMKLRRPFRFEKMWMYDDSSTQVNKKAVETIVRRSAS